MMLRIGISVGLVRLGIRIKVGEVRIMDWGWVNEVRD